MSYADLYSYHINDYQKLLHRVSFWIVRDSDQNLGHEQLTGSEEANFRSNRTGERKAVISTAERVKSFKHDEDPSLVSLLFQYGRYLLISCSRPGTQVANLQGIWNKDVHPPWEYVILSQF